MLKEVLDNMKAEEEILEKSLIKLRKNISEKKADLDKEAIEINHSLADSFTKFPMLIAFNDTLYVARHKTLISAKSKINLDGSISKNVGSSISDTMKEKIYCLYVDSFYIPVELVDKLSKQEIDDLKQEEA